MCSSDLARLEQYANGRLRNWFTYINGKEPGWPALAASYDVLVASRKGNPNLVARLEKLSGWRIIAADEQGIALVRADRVKLPPRRSGE